MVLKCMYLARIVILDILCSVNKLARSVTKWTGACDRLVTRLISKNHHTSDYRQFCHVGNTAQHCRLGLFQDSDFAGDFEDSKSTLGGSYVHLEVEDSSAESELFRWMLDCEWMDYLPVIYGMW